MKPGDPRGGIAIKKPLEQTLQALQALMNKKAESPTILDVSQLSGITDYYVLVTGNSAPHLKALANEVHRAMKNEGVHCYRKSGTPESGWLVMDYVDFVIHIFEAKSRAYYGIEEMWADAPRLDARGKHI
jgi:ribosome-associated protein